MVNSNYELLRLNERINTLENRGDKNIKAGGVLRKLKRKRRKMTMAQ